MTVQFGSNRRSLARSALAAVAVLAWLAMPAPARPQVTVYLGQPRDGHPVSPTLYGVFFEEINHAGDGGLSAQLLRNPSFRDAPPLAGWAAAGGAASTGAGNAPGGGPVQRLPRLVSLTNGGWWGVPVRAGAVYRARAFVRSGIPLANHVRFSLVGADGATIADANCSVAGARWIEVTADLRATRTDPDASFRVTATQNELDLGPMRLAELRGRGAGTFRGDVASLINGIHPSFMRFPGGCYVEGDCLANAFDWKQALGDPLLRPGHSDLWGYRSTDDLGLYEYLVLCERMKAEPLFVVNCGMSHTDRTPMPHIDTRIQDALDALEFANGSQTSKWGKVRADMGHPAPFRLRMLEIGNENGGPAYQERFAAFYDVLKARWPAVQLIANEPVASRKPDLVDEHYYNSVGWFAANAAMYDDRPRSGPGVYVGEYAVTDGCGTGNLRAAAAEAAFMTGMERNSDLVRMASYAPLLVNVNDRHWNPDAICYNASRSYGTPSYWVQRMFSSARIAATVPVRVEQPAGEEPAESGRVGVGTWSTQAEYRDVVLTTPDGRQVPVGQPTAWEALSGDWARGDGGAAIQRSAADNCLSLARGGVVSDFDLNLRARKISGREGFLVLFHGTGPDDHTWWNIGGWGNTRSALEHDVAGAKAQVGQAAPVTVEANRWYAIRISVRGRRIRCYLDGALVTDASEPGPAGMAVSAGVPATGGLLVKLSNPTSMARTVHLAGRAPTPGAACTMLTANSGTAENSLEQPDAIVPGPWPIRTDSRGYVVEIPAWSVAVVTLPGR